MYYVPNELTHMVHFAVVGTWSVPFLKAQIKPQNIAKSVCLEHSAYMQQLKRSVFSST